MKNILLPTHFSDNSWNAIKYAIQLYKNEPGTFYIFHAYTPIIYNVDYMLMAPAQLGLSDPIEEYVPGGNELTKSQIENQNQFATLFEGIAYLFHEVRVMEIAEAINEYQIKHKINLLAMVNNKHSIFENIFFKNTIHQIGFHLNIPFLVLPNIKKKNS